MIKNIMQLSINVHFLIETQIQFKILHWQTNEYSRHMAFGKIYDELTDLIDKFVEVAIGKYGRFILNNEEKILKLENISELNLKTFIKIFRENLIGMGNDLNERDTDLLNIRDEMLGEINQLAYLLTLE